MSVHSISQDKKNHHVSVINIIQNSGNKRAVQGMNWWKIFTSGSTVRRYHDNFSTPTCTSYERDLQRVMNFLSLSILTENGLVQVLWY